ncbi:MAG: lysostaphin resistance A-like protein [Propionibacteriaceae bacterium]
MKNLRGVPYQLQLRSALDPVRSMLALFLALAGFILVPLVAQLILALSWFLSGKPGTFIDYAAAGLRFENPIGVFASHIGLALLIVISIAVLHYIARLPIANIHSVEPGMRWRFLLAVAAVSLCVLGIAVTVTQHVNWGQIHPQENFGVFFLVILLTAPLQAAGEEYLFRGVLMMTLGSLWRNPWFGIVASAAVFAFFHGVQNPALFVDRFAFGILAGVLVWRTGGLEAGIAIHAVNNVLAFTMAGLFHTVADARTVQQIGWLQAVSDIGAFAIVIVVAWLIGRAMKVSTVTTETVLH